ncbi:GH14747 [Drosophila grimshawi]|uniref:GH14747 n=1 Tax=Drosophila grimshawi TaxID=7222 RepID=B4JUZ0_DROGR|nr:GH14747 [Drosophila grimshawi]
MQQSLQIALLTLRLSATCCQLTRPSLDTGNEDCRAELKLPQKRRFSFVEQYTINMCVEECNFIGSGYIDVDPPYRLDIGRIRTNLKSTLPEPQATSVPFMVKAYTKCEVFLELHGTHFALHLPELEFIKNPCKPFSLHITICVRMHAMQKCPKEFYANSAQCQMAQKYFTQCMDDIETSVG